MSQEGLLVMISQIWNEPENLKPASDLLYLWQCTAAWLGRGGSSRRCRDVLVRGSPGCLYSTNIAALCRMDAFIWFKFAVSGEGLSP